MKTSLKQKLLLLFFGLLLTSILLEISLRLAGVFVQYLQDRENHLSFNQNEYRILCLGESTTALGGEDSYPSQLQAMLNDQGRRHKFTVINKGIISTTTDYILAHIDQNLDMYKPQMVIVMMGINDKVYMHDHKSLWWEDLKQNFKNFRVYKLVRLIDERMTHRAQESKAPIQSIDLTMDENTDNQHVENFLKAMINNSVKRFYEHKSASVQYLKAGQNTEARQEIQMAKQTLIEAGSACVDLAHRYRLQGRFQEAQEVLKQAAIFNPKLPDIYLEWGNLFLAQNKSIQARNAFQAALGLDPKNSESLLGIARAYHLENDGRAFLAYAGYLQLNAQDYWGYIEFSQWLREDKHFDLAQHYLNQAIQIQPEFDQAYMDLGQMLDDQSQFDQEEAFYLKEIPQHSASPRLYQALGQLYLKVGKENLAKNNFQKAAQKDMTAYYPATLVNYSLLLEKILSRHIKVVVMQYPLTDIKPLEDYLGQKKGVFYVENKENFREALLVGGYWRYFKDNFAYNFGHCTRLGNELIAKNLTETILKHE